MIMSKIQKNDQTTINAPTNTLFVQKYANYNSTGNRTTTSSHLNSGLRIWTKKWNEYKSHWQNYLQNIFPRNLNTDLLISTSEIKMRPLVHKVRLCYHSHSHLHYLRCHTILFGYIMFKLCWSSRQEYILRPGFFRGGSGKYLRGPEAAGVESIMSNNTLH